MNTMINQTAIWSTRKMFQCFLDQVDFQTKSF